MSSINENELITKFDPLIYKLTNEILCNYESSDVCMDREDILQIGRMHVLNAIRSFDDSKGAKISTWIYRVLFTKFLNLGRDFKIKNKRKTLNMTTLERFTEDDETQKIDFGSAGGEDSILNFIDTTDAFNFELTDFEKFIFTEHIVNGHSVECIADSNKKLSVGRIQQSVDHLNLMFSSEGVNEKRFDRGTGKGWFDANSNSGIKWDYGPNGRCKNCCIAKNKSKNGRLGDVVENSSSVSDDDRQLQMGF